MTVDTYGKWLPKGDKAVIDGVDRGAQRMLSDLTVLRGMGRAGLEAATRYSKEATPDDQDTLSDCFLDEVE